MNTKVLAYKPAYTIHADATIKEALQKMMEKDSNSLCVVSEQGELKGIISIQDIAGATVPSDMQANVSLSEAMFKEGFFEEMCQKIGDKSVKTIMRREMMSASLDSNIMTIMADFLKNDLYNVPIVQDDKLVGVITRSDIRGALLDAMDY